MIYIISLNVYFLFLLLLTSSSSDYMLYILSALGHWLPHAFMIILEGSDQTELSNVEQT